MSEGGAEVAVIATTDHAAPTLWPVGNGVNVTVKLGPLDCVATSDGVWHLPDGSTMPGNPNGVTQ